MFMDVASVGKDKMAHLVTPAILSVSEPYCISFWFFISDPKSGILTVRYLVLILKLTHYIFTFVSFDLIKGFVELKISVTVAALLSDSTVSVSSIVIVTV